MFMGGDVDEASRGRPRKDPPRLEPQVEIPFNELINRTAPAFSCSQLKRTKDSDEILLESDDSTIMFSDNEDSQPPILMKPTEIVTKPPKKKKKKKNKEKKRHNKDRSPPRLEPIGEYLWNDQLTSGLHFMN